MKKEKVKICCHDAASARGIITVNVLEPKTRKEFGMVDKMRKNRRLLEVATNKVRYRIYKENLKLQKALEASCMVKRYVQDNIVNTVGLTQITKGLSGNLATLSELEVNYTAVGTDATTPVAGDTTLTVESFRNVVNTKNYASNVFFASMFIDFTEDSGTYKEAGLFINATATVDTGTLFDHVLLNSPTGIVKSTSQVLTISFQITFTSV